MSYIGTQPTQLTLETRQEFVASNLQKTFDTNQYTVGYVDCYLNGVKLSTSDFTANNGNQVVLSTGAAANDILAVVMKKPDHYPLPITDSAGNNVLSESGSVVTLTADEANIGSNALVVDSSGNVGIALTNPSANLNISTGGIGLRIDANAASGDTEINLAPKNSASSICNVSIVAESEENGFASALYFKTRTSGGTHTESMRIDSSGNVGIGTGSNSLAQGKLCIDGGADGSSIISGRTDGGNGNNERFKITAFADGGGAGYGGGIGFETRSTTNVFSEAMRIDSSGNLLVGTDSSTVAALTSAGNGVRFSPSGIVAQFASNAIATAAFNRTSNDGIIIDLRKDGTTVGGIGTEGDEIYIGTSDVALKFERSGVDRIIPWNITSNSARDDGCDLGGSAERFDDIYATNGTIQTSDRNEKQDIEELTEAEQRVAVAAKALMRKFRWKSAVAKKGDEARIHFGIIAQDLQAAFEAEGLDAGRYAMFMSNTWWETSETYTDDEGVEQTRTNTYDTAEEAPEGAVERTRLGVRYSELLAFIIAAI